MGMGMSCSPALWQQFVHIIWEQLPNKERYKIKMDDILIFSTKEQHWEDLRDFDKSVPSPNKVWIKNLATQMPAVS